MTHTETINGKQVIFETVQVAERIEHSTTHFMNGYTGDKLTHTAIGSFAIGSDDFEGISYIEEEQLEKNEQLPELTLDQAIEKAKPNMDKIKDVDVHLNEIK